MPCTRFTVANMRTGGNTILTVTFWLHRPLTDDEFCPRTFHIVLGDTDGSGRMRSFYTWKTWKVCAGLSLASAANTWASLPPHLEKQGDWLQQIPLLKFVWVSVKESGFQHDVRLKDNIFDHIIKHHRYQLTSGCWARISQGPGVGYASMAHPGSRLCHEAF